MICHRTIWKNISMCIMNWMRFRTFLTDFPQKRRQCLSFEEAGTVYGLAVAEKQSERCLSDLRRICDRRISGRTGHRNFVTGWIHLVTPDLKGLLKHVRVPETKNCIDATIAAYLLNPLKNEYTYDDLARDILGLMVPSQRRICLES